MYLKKKVRKSLLRERGDRERDKDRERERGGGWRREREGGGKRGRERGEGEGEGRNGEGAQREGAKTQKGHIQTEEQRENKTDSFFLPITRILMKDF